MKGVVLKDWRKYVILPLYKDKDDKANLVTIEKFVFLTVVQKIHTGILIESASSD